MSAWEEIPMSICYCNTPINIVWDIEKLILLYLPDLMYKYNRIIFLAFYSTR